MTLVSVIRLGKGSGVAYADSEVTYAGNHEERTYQLRGRKLRRLGNSNSFAGVAGHSEYGRQIMDLAYTKAKKSLAFAHPTKLKNAVLDAYKEVRRELIKNLELDPIGASWEAYRRGRLSKRIMEKIDGVLREPALMDVCIVFGGSQRPMTAGRKGNFQFDNIDDEFYLYRIDPPGVLTYPRGFDIVGNGIDIAEPIVAGFMEDAPIWGSLPLYKGAQVLVKAKTESEKRNPGVGMIGRMVYVHDGRLRELDRPETKVLESSMECLEHGLLNQEGIDELFKIATTKEAPLDAMLALLGERVDKDALFRQFFTDSCA